MYARCDISVFYFISIPYIYTMIIEDYYMQLFNYLYSLIFGFLVYIYI